MTEIERAAVWAAELYQERTIAVAEDRGDILSACAAYRVCWTEVRSQFPGVTLMDRTDFQPLYEREIRKRGLLRVLRGTQTAQSWLKWVRSRSSRNRPKPQDVPSMGDVGPKTGEEVADKARDHPPNELMLEAVRRLKSKQGRESVGSRTPDLIREARRGALHGYDPAE